MLGLRGLSYLVENREENNTRTNIFQKDGVTMPFLLLMYSRGALLGMELYIIFAMCKQVEVLFVVIFLCPSILKYNHYV